MPQGFKGWAIFAAAQTAITVILHWLAKLADNAMLTWIDDQIAMFLGFSQPQASTVISWVLLAFIVFVMLLTYHIVQSRVFRMAPVQESVVNDKSAPTPTPRQQITVARFGKALDFNVLSMFCDNKKRH